ncbi:MAG: diacylglycerol/lipid kinase family protein [Brachybacterium tyrofermentans]|uniref:Diacylglycerol/lipid kinase family protein n=1 Tax=Brachybacterium tyrofermentans TaxID=47848 RepID=A0ABW0FJS1_9MICO|nr:diacylglycerol kinase family protein [Brachybacterium tyrofermentans]SLN04800.1 Diacylglycerol kinase-related protein [Corynebacterium xerosis]
MSRLRVGLLSNPTAALGTARRVGRQVGDLLRLAGISVVDLSGPSAHVARARAEEVRDTLTALVVVGGDGTVALGAEIVAGSPVRLGIVPAGSGNDLARALGLPLNDPEESTRILLHALSRPVVTVDAIEVVSTGEHALPHRSIALGNVNLGFDALVNARANSSQHSHTVRYKTAVLRELPAFKPFPYWIEVDGGPRQELDASIVTISNSGIFGGGMRIAPQARLDDSSLELITLEGIGRAELLRFFPRVFRGTHTSVPGFAIRPVREVTIGLRHGRALRAYSDGEARTLLPLTARILPGAVRLLADLTPEDAS